jgi:hypothetical protein
MSRPSAIQRAFALARNGAGLSIAVIRQRLRDEGYEDDKITSPVVLRQLRRILVDARRKSWKRRLARRGNHALSEQKRKRELQ